MIFKNAELYNVYEIKKSPDGEGCLMSRIPEEVRLKLNDEARKRAYFSPGCEIRFVINEGSAEITLMRSPGGDVLPTGIAEIYHGCFQGSYQITPFVIGNEPVKIRIEKPARLEMMEALSKEYRLPFDPNVTRVLLPYDWENRLVDIQGDIAPPSAEQVPDKKILCYGSSITHGGSGVHPSEAYASKLAGRLGFDLINLGFAGSARMEAAMADYIAEREWDVATLEMGINVINDWTLEQFEERIDYFISRIAGNNRDRWIFCTDLYTNARDYAQLPKVEQFRRAVRKKVEALNLPKLVYIPGRQLLNDPAGLSADLVHPSSAGMDTIANNFYRVISERIKQR